MALTRRIFLGTGAGVLAQAQTIAPSDRISVGMIAVGSRSHELIEAIKRVDGTEIVGVCDAYTGRVERAIDRTEGRAKKYANYKDILADPSIDAVTIGTPDHWHRQMVIEALQAGKDVYCEKPLTFTIDEGLEIAAAAERAGKVLQVGSQGHQQRQHENAARLGPARQARPNHDDSGGVQPQQSRRSLDLPNSFRRLAGNG